jgi:hypothetical protein
MQQPQTALLLRALRRFYRARAPDISRDNTPSEASASTLVDVAWLSIDPVRRKIDFYPKAIAARVEKAYQDRDPWSPSTCVLGSDFFNSTVHFHPSGTLYQTTPEMAIGSRGFKPKGYRSVKRVVKPDEGDLVTIFAKQVHGEWRIAANKDDAEIKFEVSSESIPKDNLVHAEQFRVWTANDLTSNASDVSVVVWQWCRGVPERHGSFMELSDDWWCPYLSDANSTIESAFSVGQESVLVSVLVRLLGKELTIKFTPGQSRAVQRIESEGKERAVRRVIKTVEEVKVMLNKINTPPLDPAKLAEDLPQGTIPPHFFCPILQDVMVDPVKTVDDITYDRPAIQRWFKMRSTSPLTGLPLASKALVPHVTLREQIESFNSHAHPMQGAQAGEHEVGGGGDGQKYDD